MSYDKLSLAHNFLHLEVRNEYPMHIRLMKRYLFLKTILNSSFGHLRGTSLSTPEAEVMGSTHLRSIGTDRLIS